jgi:hypothetical protein
VPLSGQESPIYSITQFVTIAPSTSLIDGTGAVVDVTAVTFGALTLSLRVIVSIEVDAGTFGAAALTF